MHYLKHVIFIFLSMALLNACDQGSSTNNSTDKNVQGTGIELPKVLQDTSFANGTMHAYISVDTSPRQELVIIGNQASSTINNLSASVHNFTIEFVFVYDDNTEQPVTLATASTLLDLSRGQNQLTFQDSDYEYLDYDFDEDTIPNLIELADGTDPFIKDIFLRITSQDNITFDENDTTAKTIAAITNVANTTLTYSISETSTDLNLFSINPQTGSLAFINPPNYEVRLDNNTDNIYSLEIQVSDSEALDASQTLSITVLDLNESPEFTSPAFTTIDEGEQVIEKLTAIDPENAELRFSIEPGKDQNLFSINSIEGVLNFISSPVYDINNSDNNIYAVDVSVTDGVNTTIQSLAIFINPVSTNVAFTAPTNSNIGMLENARNVVTISATSSNNNNPIQYGFVAFNRIDNDLFTINSSSGLLQFKTAPDYENPMDQGQDNTYQVFVSASDGEEVLGQILLITVTDVIEVVEIAPGTPANVIAVAGQDTVTINWDAVSDTDNYRVYWNTSGNVSTGDSYISAGSQTQLTHLNLTNITYYYAVVAVNSVGLGGLSEITSATPDSGNVDTIPPIISLSGANLITLIQGAAYVEAGASATDNLDGSVEVTISGSVDVNTIGNYVITYSATDAANNMATATRAVNIVIAADTTPPVITLNGANIVNLIQGSAYAEAGAIATDGVDGSIVVTVSGSVDVNTVGNYVITYSATDAANNTASAIRTVNIVLAADTTPPVITLSGANTINLIRGNAYVEAGASATDDRDGSVNVSISGSVDVSTAGGYVITYGATDLAGNTATLTRTINVIDITPDAFSFVSQNNVAVNTQINSNTVVITGISDGTSISISGGLYALNGGSVFGSSTTTINNGQSVQLRLLSSTTGVISTSATLTVGSVSETFTVTTMQTETVPPAVTIAFPPAKSLTEGNSVIVRGYSSDASGVAGVAVNGVEATSTDGFANWTATVNLTPGENSLTTTVTDNQTNTANQSVEIRSAPLADQISQLTLDNANNRFLMIENNQLIEVSRATGLSSRISSGNLGSGSYIELDSNSNRMIAMDNQDGVSTIKEVNLLTGVTTNISQDALAAPIGSFASQLYDLAHDKTNNRLFIADGVYGVIEMDLISGNRTNLSDARLYAMVLDAANNRLIGTRNGSTVLAVDINTGVQTILGSAGVSSAYAIAYDGNNRVFVAGSSSNNIVQLNLADGVATTISDNVSFTGDVDFSYIASMEYDPANGGRLIVSDSANIIDVNIGTGVRTSLGSSSPSRSKYGTIYDSVNKLVYVVNRGSNLTVFDLNNGGASTIISDNTIAVADSNVSFGDIWGLEVDVIAGVAYISDWTTASIIQVELATGIRTVFADNSIPDASNTFITPTAFAWDETGNRMLVLDSGRRSLIEVDFSTDASGVRRVISSRQQPDDKNAFINPRGIKLDLTNNRAIILDSDSYSSTTILAVDLTDGARTIITSVPTSTYAHYRFDVDIVGSRVFLPNRNGLTELSFAGVSSTAASGDFAMVAYDSVSGNAFAGKIDSNDRSRDIVEVNLASATVSPVPTSVTPDINNPMDNPYGIVVDETNNRAFVTDGLRAAVFAMDLDTGARTLFADNTIASGLSNVDLTAPQGIILDSARNRLLVVDRQVVMAISLDTRARTIVSDNNTAVADSTIDFAYLYDLSLDIQNNRILVVQNSPASVIAVDLSNGARTILADNNTAVAQSTIDLQQTLFIEVDAANNRALMNAYPSLIIAVDLDSGARTVFSDNTNLGDDYQTPWGIVLDTANDRLIVQGYFYNKLISANLSDGARTAVPSYNFNSVFTFGTASIAFDARYNRVLVVEDDRDAIIAVDVVTGAKVILSQ